MIADAVLEFMFGVFEIIIGLFPDDLSLAGTLGEFAAINAGPYVGWVDSVIAVAPIAALVSFMLSCEVALLIVRVALFVWRLTPLSG